MQEYIGEGRAGRGRAEQADGTKEIGLNSPCDMTSLCMLDPILPSVSEKNIFPSNRLLASGKSHLTNHNVN